ncbi:MAG: hypothetical protein PUA98_00280 [Selenomonadaceae bacterium]|nr:hypothetical protein [Selenomonadaceae bacterium]
MNKQKNIFFIMAIMLAALIFVVSSIYDGSEMDEADLVSYKESLDSLKKGDYNLDQYLVLVSQIAYSKDLEERRNLSSQMRKTEGSIVECISQSKLILDNAIYTEDEAALKQEERKNLENAVNVMSTIMNEGSAIEKFSEAHAATPAINGQIRDFDEHLLALKNQLREYSLKCEEAIAAIEKRQKTRNYQASAAAFLYLIIAALCLKASSRKG